MNFEIKTTNLFVSTHQNENFGYNGTQRSRHRVFSTAHQRSHQKTKKIAFTREKKIKTEGVKWVNWIGMEITFFFRCGLKFAVRFVCAYVEWKCVMSFWLYPTEVRDELVPYAKWLKTHTHPMNGVFWWWHFEYVRHYCQYWERIIFVDYICSRTLHKFRFSLSKM